MTFMTMGNITDIQYQLTTTFWLIVSPETVTFSI